MKTESEPRGRGRPATGQMPKRYFRMGDDDWQQIESAASASDQTVSEYVRSVLMNHAARILKSAQKK